jgi:cytochrome c-type biogenesis protein CcmH
MTWALIIALALVAFVALTLVLRVPRSGWEAVLAALVLGLAGYAAQGHWNEPGAPRAADEKPAANPEALVVMRQKLAGKDDQTDSWLMVADAMSRHGQFADAANILRGSIDRNPTNGQAWLALANALVSHGQGSLSPAALLAFHRAAAIEPASPGPPFFLGLALARSGQMAAGRAQWAGLLARSPQDAPWRPDLTNRLAELDAFIAQARQVGMQP